MKNIATALGEHGRATEWLTSLALLMMVLTMALPGDTLGRPGFHVLAAMGFEEASVAVPLALVATGRLAALYINGAWRRSPALRMWGAMAGAATFGALAVSFAWPWAAGGTVPGTGAGTYLVLAVFDVVAAYRSGADVRLVSDARA